MISMRKIILISLIILVYSCKSDINQIPEIYVNFSIPKSDVGGVGQGIYINNRGVKGIILFQNDFDSYLAYDRACSYAPQESCELIEFDDILAPVMLIDSCCGSKFFLCDGTATNGPASLPLKKYQTWTDENYVYVTN